MKLVRGWKQRKRWEIQGRLSYSQELSQALDQVVNPTDNLCFIGPTKYDDSMLSPRDRIQEVESDLFHEWKEIDLREYRQTEFW